MELQYFTESEFEKCSPRCCSDDMDTSTLSMLEKMREIYGKPIIITSAYRSFEYEISKGRAGTSSHCKGLALDIRCFSPADRLGLIDAALRAGFRRIGIASTFIHVDNDSDKLSCIWLY